MDLLKIIADKYNLMMPQAGVRHVVDIELS